MKSFDGYLKKKLGDSYALLAGGGHKNVNDFFLNKGFLYQNNNWDADTLSIGSWSFKGAGYGGVGSGAAHAHCLSENSIIEVFENVLLSATAWSDQLSYRISWDRESNSNRPNGWGPWLTIARTSDIPTKSSWNYDDVYSKLGHTHAYTDITGSGNTADMALVSTTTANILQFKLLGSHAFDSTEYLPTAGGTMIGEETIAATSAIMLPLRSYNGTRATVYTNSSTGVIHGGEDNASYLGANVQIGTWYGFGIYNSYSGEKAGKNTFWHDARSGNTYTWGTYYKFAKVNGTDTYTEVSYNGHKHDSDYIQSVSISGNNLKITKNNSDSDLTIPYATSAGNADTVTRFKYLDNWNSSTLGDNKVYFISNTSDATGAPGACYSGVSFMTNYVGFQLCTYGGSSEDLNFRKYKDSNNGAAWTTWRTIYHSGNLPAYPTKDSWNYDDRYVTAVGNGTGDYVNNLYYTKNGSNSYFTVNYATNANTATHIKLTYINSSSNLNDIANGFYYHSDLNNPTNFVSYNCAFLQFSGRGGYDKFQLEFGANEERIWFRKASNNIFTSWKTIAWTSDIPTIPSTYDWSAITNKPETATRWPSWDEVISKPDIWSTVTITKTLKPTTSWLDTGIVTTDLGEEGLYVLTVKHPDSSDGYYPSHAGLMYNYTNYTNGSMGLEIPLHYGSHHLDYGRIFLRTLLTPNTNGKTKILIRSIDNYSYSHTFTFKFRRII